jgi:hypothetical protein
MPICGNQRLSLPIDAMTSPGPFRSKLIPYVDQIKAWRRAGHTWKDVTQELAKLDVKTDPGSVCRFIKRWTKKPYAIGTEPEDAAGPEAIPRQRRATRRDKPPEGTCSPPANLSPAEVEAEMMRRSARGAEAPRPPLSFL